MDRRAFLTSLAGAGLTAGLAMAMPATAEADSWIELGSRKVDGLIDIDRINVGQGWGLFRKIRVKVRGNNLLLQRLIVRFENNEEQVIQLNRLYPQGSDTGGLDLAGDKRFIRRVTFIYSKFPNGQGPTRVLLEGRR